MIRNVKVGINGKTVVELIPENDDDLRILEAMMEAGQLDARDSFADEPAMAKDDKRDADSSRK